MKTVRAYSVKKESLRIRCKAYGRRINSERLEFDYGI